MGIGGGGDVQSILDNLANADPVGESLQKNVRDRLAKFGVGPLARNIIAGTMGAAVSGVLVVIGLLIGIVAAIGAPLVTMFLRILTKTRTDTVQEQVQISASVLSEFLATEINPEHLKTGKTGDETINAARAIGDALINRLTKEFVPQGAISNTSGEEAAKTFAGYAVNFAVQNTMISTLADALSFHLLEDFRELGVEVAQNLGLGRLVRQAIQPLVRNAISQPYDRQLRARYRQDQIADDQYVKGWFAEKLQEADMREMLAQKGYSDRDIDLLLQFAAERLPENDLLAFVRYGVLTQDQATQKLVDSGMIRPLAGDVMKAQLLRRMDDQWSAFVGVIIRQVTDRRIDVDTFNKLLDKVPFTDDEKQVIRDQIGEELEIPTQFLTWSEVTTAFENGIVDMDYVDAWLEREGYGDDDQLNKEFLLLLKFDAFTTKQQLADAKKNGTLKGATATTIKPQPPA